MGIRCSLLGHDYGHPTTEQDRREREGETVLVVREYRSCRRCGHEQDIYANQGVIATAPDDGDTDAKAGEPVPAAGPDEATGDAAAADAEAGETTDHSHDEMVDDASAADDSAPGGPAVDATGDADRPDGTAATDLDSNVATDAETAGVGPDTTGPSANAADTETDATTDAGADADADVDGIPDADTTVTGDQAPEAASEPNTDASGATTEVTDVASDAAPEPTDDGAIILTDESTSDDRERADGADAAATKGATARYVCQECGHAVSAAAAALHEGDICTECHRGYYAYETSDEG